MVTGFVADYASELELFLVKTNIPPLFFLHPQISSGRFIPCQRKTGMVMPPDRIIFAASLLYFLCSRD